jgi:hypothetical protein
MRHQLLLRLLTCLAVAVPALFLSASVAPGAVGAAAAPLTVTCTTLSGNGVTQMLSHCTGSAAVVDQAGKSPAHGTNNLNTRTITWSNGRRTAETYTYTPLVGAADTCPARTKYTKQYLVNEKGWVAFNGTTAKGMVSGVVKARVCVYHLTAYPHNTIVVNQGKITI